MTTTADTCVECQEREANLNIRHRRLCAACFIRYVNSKILKRMESYRFKSLAQDQNRRLFLPISGGISSLVLLQVLDTQLHRQIASRNRTAYELVIARVLLPNTQDLARVETEYQSLARRFPLHTFLPLVPFHDILQLDDRIGEDIGYLGIYPQSGESDKDVIERILSSATSVTTRADLESILLQRLLVSVAKKQNCEGVLWGHSDSRLAALALADVAKGRGGSVSSNIAEGPSLHLINFNYPARDLFKAELKAYAHSLPEPLMYDMDDGVPGQQMPSIRNTSINSLLSGYITSQGDKYPSIMANVVRTASKLQVQTLGKGVVACSFCYMPMAKAEQAVLCYGCERLKQDIKAQT